MVLEEPTHGAAESRSIPTDAALPGLSLLVRPPELVEFLSSLLVEWMDAGKRISDCRVNLLRYVPGKRCIVALQLRIESKESGGVECRKLIAKAYANGRGKKVYSTLRELQNHGFADGLLTVSQPLAYDAKWQLLLLRHCEGELLRNLVLTQSNLEWAMEGAAEWLAKLHRCGLTRGRGYSLQHHLRTLEARRQHLERVSSEVARSFEGILARIRRQIEKIEERRLGPTHRDFSPDHLLVDGAHFTGLDFDEFCQYDPIFDVGHFIAHVGYLGLLHSGSLHRFDPLAERFSATYQSRAGIQSLAQLEPYLGLAYLKLAQIVALVTRPDGWRQMTETILAEAQRFSQVK